MDVQYYNDMVKRIMREHKIVIHPRTQEIILATEDKKPNPYHKKHLGAFPCVAYSRTRNRVQISGRFIVSKRETTEHLKPTDIQKLQYELVGELKFKNTKQYKTVWNTRHQRRSKA